MQGFKFSFKELTKIVKFEHQESRIKVFGISQSSGP